MDWLMVPKAAVRSNMMRIVRWPESEERRTLLVTLRRTVSVLCCERKCFEQVVEGEMGFDLSSDNAFRNFRQKGRLEMG